MRLSPILAVLAPVLGAVALAVPSPWSWTLAALALLAGAGAGLVTRVPACFVGRPLVSGPLAAALGTLSGYLFQASLEAPEGWPRAALLAAAVVCAGAAGVPLPSPGAKAAPLLVALLCATDAHAGSPRYRIRADGTAAPQTITVATAACPTALTASDGIANGISLSGVRAWTVEICPATVGAYFTGAGLLKTCTYSHTEWGSGSWALGPDLDPGATDLTTTAANPCRRFWDIEVGVGLSDRVYVYPSTDLGLSAGTQVRVRLFGETR